MYISGKDILQSKETEMEIDMKRFKKNIVIAAVMSVMVFALAACTKKETSDTFGYNNGSVLLTPGVKFNADAEGMPETTAYMEAASCYFEGLDKVFTYEGYEITTYPKEDGDYIQDVNISSETIKTDKGVGVGRTLDEVEAAYGSDYTVSGKMYEYYQDNEKYMYFFILNDVVQYYGYGMDVK